MRRAVVGGAGGGGGGWGSVGAGLFATVGWGRWRWQDLIDLARGSFFGFELSKVKRKLYFSSAFEGHSLSNAVGDD